MMPFATIHPYPRPGRPVSIAPMKRLLPLAVAVGLVSMAAVPAYAADPIAGRYLTDDGGLVIEIAACGPALCGKVSKVLKPKAGSKAIVGTTVLSGLVDGGSLWKGTIHNPDNGKTYKAKVKRNADRTLKVEGCVAIVCKGPTWTPTT